MLAANPAKGADQHGARKKAKLILGGFWLRRATTMNPMGEFAGAGFSVETLRKRFQ
jgi:hypothetical protein